MWEHISSRGTFYSRYLQMRLLWKCRMWHIFGKRRLARTRNIAPTNTNTFISSAIKLNQPYITVRISQCLVKNVKELFGRIIWLSITGELIQYRWFQMKKEDSYFYTSFEFRVENSVLHIIWIHYNEMKRAKSYWLLKI